MQHILDAKSMQSLGTKQVSGTDLKPRRSFVHVVPFRVEQVECAEERPPREHVPSEAS